MIESKIDEEQPKLPLSQKVDESSDGDLGKVEDPDPAQVSEMFEEWAKSYDLKHINDSEVPTDNIVTQKTDTAREKTPAQEEKPKPKDDDSDGYEDPYADLGFRRK